LVSFSSIELDRLFREDGLLLKEEFESLLMRAPKISVFFHLSDVTEYLSIKNAFQIFDLMDIDGNGIINDDDFAKFMVFFRSLIIFLSIKSFLKIRFLMILEARNPIF